MKRVLTIQDFSCVGKCSLTSALPVISAFGVEACALPTALLSCHTQFSDWTFLDLAGEVASIVSAWQKAGVTFDGIACGYLGSAEAVQGVHFLLSQYKAAHIPFLLDPVMGDHGKLYARFDSSYVECVRALAGNADIITPNLTEACLLANAPWTGEQPSEAQINDLLDNLTGICDNVVITGVRHDGKIGVACRLNGMAYSFMTRRACDMHGAGDLFASTLFGALTVGKSIRESIDFACQFTTDCIVESEGNGFPAYGVSFEQSLGKIVAFAKK